MIGLASALCATHVVARSTKRSLVPVPGWWYSSPTPSGQTAVASQKHPARKRKLCFCCWFFTSHWGVNIPNGHLLALLHVGFLRKCKESTHLVGGFNPSEKYARQIGSFPQVGVKIKNI